MSAEHRTEALHCPLRSDIVWHLLLALGGSASESACICGDGVGEIVHDKRTGSRGEYTPLCSCLCAVDRCTYV